MQKCCKPFDLWTFISSHFGEKKSRTHVAITRQTLALCMISLSGNRAVNHLPDFVKEKYLGHLLWIPRLISLLNWTRLFENMNRIVSKLELIITVWHSPRLLLYQTTDAPTLPQTRWSVFLTCTFVHTANMRELTNRGEEAVADFSFTPRRRYSLVVACTPSDLNSVESRWKHAHTQAFYHTLQAKDLAKQLHLAIQDKLPYAEKSTKCKNKFGSGDF
jgi:hypothetical protein